MEAIPFSIKSYEKLVCTDKTHVVQTLSGRPVRILSTNRRAEVYSVVGLTDHKEGETYDVWTPSGVYDTAYEGEDADLVITIKPPVSLGWVVVYKAPHSPVKTTPPWADRGALLSWCRTNHYELLSKPTEMFEIALPQP